MKIYYWDLNSKHKIIQKAWIVFWPVILNLWQLVFHKKNKVQLGDP